MKYAEFTFYLGLRALLPNLHYTLFLQIVQKMHGESLIWQQGGAKVCTANDTIACLLENTLDFIELQ